MHAHNDRELLESQAPVEHYTVLGGGPKVTGGIAHQGWGIYSGLSRCFSVGIGP